jgi:hypothetical protein
MTVPFQVPEVIVPELITKPLMVSVAVGPLNAPAEVIVPDPVVEILPEVVTLSPAVAGERVVPVLDQYPIVPEVGAVEVKFFEPSV